MYQLKFEMRRIFLSLRSQNQIDDLFDTNKATSSLILTQEHLTSIVNSLQQNNLSFDQEEILVTLMQQHSPQLEPYNELFIQIIPNISNQNIINQHILYSKHHLYLTPEFALKFNNIYHLNSLQATTFALNLLLITKKTSINQQFKLLNFEQTVTPQILQNLILSKRESLDSTLKIIKLASKSITSPSEYAEAMFFALSDQIASCQLISTLQKIAPRVKWINTQFELKYPQIRNYLLTQQLERFQIISFINFVVHKYEFSRNFVQQILSDFFQIARITPKEIEISIEMISFSLQMYKFQQAEIANFMRFLVGNLYVNDVNSSQLSVIQTINYHIEVFLEDESLVNLVLFKLEKVRIEGQGKLSAQAIEYYVHLISIVRQLKEGQFGVNESIVEQLFNLVGKNPEIDDLLDELK